MQFNPNNKVVKLCLQGMAMEDGGKPDEAIKIFMQEWDEAENDHEKFLAAHYISRHQKNVNDKLTWLETALHHAVNINDNSVKSAFPSLYLNIAKCYQESGDAENAKKNFELSKSFNDNPADDGPFYHGTKADLKIGDLLTPGSYSN